jgi:hypothetical protein
MKILTYEITVKYNNKIYRRIYFKRLNAVLWYDEESIDDSPLSKEQSLELNKIYSEYLKCEKPNE